MHLVTTMTTMLVMRMRRMYIIGGSFFYDTLNSFFLVVGPNCVDYRPYTGNQSTSQAANACQSWKARGFTDNHIRGSTVVDAQNFCRHRGLNSAYQPPVCITSIGIENCNVPKCPSKCINIYLDMTVSSITSIFQVDVEIVRHLISEKLANQIHDPLLRFDFLCKI